MTDELEKEHQWDKCAEETDEQFAWFTCYLNMGFARTVRKAFALWVTEHAPEESKCTSRLGKADEGRQWEKTALMWEWHRRAVAYDEFMGQDALNIVKQQQMRLKQLTINAVDALEKNLSNPRLGVTAAVAILDRAGLPAKVVNENLNANVNVTADDMAEAMKEVDSWEKSILGENGLSADNQ